MSSKPEIATESIKSAPPMAVLTATAAGFTLQEWVYIATLAYIGLQAAWLMWKWWKAAHTKGWNPE